MIFIPDARAAELTTERLIDILRAKMGDRLDDLYDRRQESIGGQQVTLCDDDLYLPTPSTFIRQAGPDTRREYCPPEPQIYVGQDGEPNWDQMGNAIAYDGRDGAAYEVRVPYGVQIFFADAPQTLDAPSGGREMADKEVKNLRAMRYLGGIKDCIQEFGCAGTDLSNPKHRSIENISPQGDYHDSREIVFGRGEDAESVTTAKAHYRFTVHQRRWSPHQSKL